MSGYYYPVTIEPFDDPVCGPSFIAKFRDVPEANKVGAGADDALELCVGSLTAVLIEKYLAGERMPRPSPILHSEISVTTPFFWF